MVDFLVLVYSHFERRAVDLRTAMWDLSEPVAL